jgi:hypothetical protein
MLSDEQDYLGHIYSIASKYYSIIGLLSGFFPALLAVSCWFILRWPFDPPNKFERRRIRMRKDLQKMLKPPRRAGTNVSEPQEEVVGTNNTAVEVPAKGGREDAYLDMATDERLMYKETEDALRERDYQM